jgi:hypothetical protein
MADLLVRLRGALAILPIGKTKFEEDFVKTGRVRKVKVGPRATAYVVQDLKDVVDELIAEAAAKAVARRETKQAPESEPTTQPKPAQRVKPAAPRVRPTAARR